MATKYKLPRITARMAEVSCLRDADHTPLLILAINAKKVQTFALLYFFQLGLTLCPNTFLKPNLQLIELLLKCGADTNATDKHGRSVLEYALQWKDTDFFSDLVKMLFEHGCDPRRSCTIMHLKQHIIPTRTRACPKNQASPVLVCYA